MGKPGFEHWGGDLTEDLRKLFVADEDWPLAAASLAALIDLGMPDDEIANYFGVRTENVAQLRRSYGMDGASD